MQSDVNQAVEDLIKSGKADTEEVVYSFPKMHTDDIYPIFKHYFNAEAQKAFGVRAHQLIHQRNELGENNGIFVLLHKLGLKSCEDISNMYIRRFDRVHFCASTADTKATIHKSVEKIILTVNDLASKGHITAALMPLCVLALAPIDRIESQFVVLSYIALTDKGSEYAKQQFPKMFVDEGQMPERFENQ